MPAVTMLSAVHTAEVSLVKRAANKKKFAITKSEDVMNPEILKAVLSTPAEGEAELVATMKSAGADDKRVHAAVAAFRLQKGFADVLKSADIAVVLKAAGYKADADADDDTDAAEKAKKSKTKKSADEVVAGMDPEARALVQSVFKANEDLTAKTAGLQGLVEQLAGTVKSLVNKSADVELVAKAEKQFSHVPGSPQEIARVLKSAQDAGPEATKTIETMLTAVNELVQKSAAFTSLGSTGAAGAQPGSAYERIEALAGQLTMKSDKGNEMSKEQKIAHVITKTAEGRALYRTYLGENPKQRASHNY